MYEVKTCEVLTHGWSCKCWMVWVGCDILWGFILLVSRKRELFTELMYKYLYFSNGAKLQCIFQKNHSSMIQKR